MKMVCVNKNCFSYVENEFNKCTRWEYMPNCGYKLISASEKENKDLKYDSRKVQQGINNEFLKYLDDNEPKEKLMEDKVIFESEEEAFKIIAEAYWDNSLYADRNAVNECVKRLKQKGYIRKSAVEEAEEIWNDWKPNGKDRAEDNRFIVIQHECIQELKSEIERLKNANR